MNVTVGGQFVNDACTVVGVVGACVVEGDDSLGFIDYYYGGTQREVPLIDGVRLSKCSKNVSGGSHLEVNDVRLHKCDIFRFRNRSVECGSHHVVKSFTTVTSLAIFGRSMTSPNVSRKFASITSLERYIYFEEKSEIPKPQTYY